ncbi:MAG: hypothetical protein AAFR46_06790 [Pseudomonadota bacterium]
MRHLRILTAGVLAWLCAGLAAPSVAQTPFDAKAFLAPLREACLTPGLSVDARLARLTGQTRQTGQTGWSVLEGEAAVAVANTYIRWSAVRRGFDFEELVTGSDSYLAYFKDEVERLSNPTSLEAIEEQSARTDGRTQYLNGPEAWQGRIAFYDDPGASLTKCLFWVGQSRPETDAALIEEMTFLDPLSAPFGRMWSTFSIGPKYQLLQGMLLIVLEPGSFERVPLTGIGLELR